MKRTRTILAGLCLAASTAFAGSAVDGKAVLTHYADMAHAKYEDSLTTAKILQQAVGQLIDAPTQATLNAARDSWKEARVPYQQTEVYRFGNAIVDEWEGKVNAWPLDEGFTSGAA